MKDHLDGQLNLKCIALQKVEKNLSDLKKDPSIVVVEKSEASLQTEASIEENFTQTYPVEAEETGGEKYKEKIGGKLSYFSS
jgi:hypothetical protein